MLLQSFFVCLMVVCIFGVYSMYSLVLVFCCLNMMLCLVMFDLWMCNMLVICWLVRQSRLRMIWSCGFVVLWMVKNLLLVRQCLCFVFLWCLMLMYGFEFISCYFMVYWKISCRKESLWLVMFGVVVLVSLSVVMCLFFICLGVNLVRCFFSVFVVIWYWVCVFGVIFGVWCEQIFLISLVMLFLGIVIWLVQLVRVWVMFVLRLFYLLFLMYQNWLCLKQMYGGRWWFFFCGCVIVLVLVCEFGWQCCCV